jgi:hypothetical protein
MRQFTAVLQDRKHGPYRTQRLSASSPMELMLHLLERKQAVVDVRDDRQLPPLARKQIKPLEKCSFSNSWSPPPPLAWIQLGQWKSPM